MNYQSNNLRKGLFVVAIVLVLAVARLSSSNLTEARNAPAVIDNSSCPIALENSFELINKPALLKLSIDESKNVLKSLNTSISEKLALYQKTQSVTDKNNLLSLLVNRKQALGHLSKIESASAGSYKLSNQETVTIENLFRNCLEKTKELNGKLEILIADFPDSKKSTETYKLRTSTGEVFNILVSDPNSPITKSKGGSSIKVRGTQIDDYIIPNEIISDNGPSRSDIEIGGSQAGDPILGNQRVLAVLANFQGSPQPNLTRSGVNNLIFTNSKNYYQENSYGQASLTGTVLAGPSGSDWYTIPINQTCDFNSVLNALIPLIDSTVDFHQYDYLAVVSPFGPACGWSGISTIGKITVETNEGPVSIGTSFMLASYMTNHFVFSHEIGHAFGERHASFWSCGSNPINSNCLIDEYGDLYDVMGGSFIPGHFNALHKEYVGWMGGGRIQNVTQSGTYTLEPIETNLGGFKALKIQRSANDYLFIEYRQPIGADNSIGTNSNVFSGVTMHTIKTASGFAPNQSLLIDPTPPGSNLNVALEAGGVFVDPLSGNIIGVLSADPEHVTLDVNLIKTDFTSPVVSITEPISNSSVPQDATIKVSATDQGGISKVEFFQIVGFGENGFLALDNIFPFEALVHFPTIGAKTIYAEATDLAGNKGVSMGIPLTVIEGPIGVCGDADGDNGVNISDAVYLINYIFNGGPAPRGDNYSDANGDGMINISDAVYLINYIFSSGPTPVCS